MWTDDWTLAAVKDCRSKKKYSKLGKLHSLYISELNSDSASMASPQIHLVLEVYITHNIERLSFRAFVTSDNYVLPVVCHTWHGTRTQPPKHVFRVPHLINKNTAFYDTGFADQSNCFLSWRKFWTNEVPGV